MIKEELGLKGKILWSGRYLALLVPANLEGIKTIIRWVRMDDY